MYLPSPRRLCLAIWLVVCVTSFQIVHAAESLLYVGTYTRGTASRGIYVYRFDDATGSLRQIGIAEGVDNPSFLAIHADRKHQFLFSADEVNDFEGQSAGSISAWAIDDTTGKLSLINRQSSGGAGPCYLAVDVSGHHVLVANYAGGTVAVLRVDAAGQLQRAVTRIEHQGSSVDSSRQSSPHPHEIVLDPQADFALVPDLGLDQIVVYRFDRDTGSLAPNDPPYAKMAPGAGPRHLAFAPDGRHAYVINELSVTITSCDYDAKRGILTPRRTISALAEGTDRTGASGAEIAIQRDGKSLYASLRGVDQLVGYRLDSGTGALKFLERTATGGKTPRNFTLDPSGKWLLAANQDSGNINVFRIDSNGRLSVTGNKVDVPAPVCLVFLSK